MAEKIKENCGKQEELTKRQRKRKMVGKFMGKGRKIPEKTIEKKRRKMMKKNEKNEEETKWRRKEKKTVAKNK